MPRPSAVVIDVGWVAALAAVRSLGRGGVRLLAVNDRRGRSRYAEVHLAPIRSGLGFVDFLRELGEGVTSPTHDDDLETIARHRDELALTYPFPVGRCSATCRTSANSSWSRTRSASRLRGPRTSRPARSASRRC